MFFYTVGHDNVDLKGTTVISIDENIEKIPTDCTCVIISPTKRTTRVMYQ